MRSWGYLISALYAVLVAGLFLPAVVRLGGRSWSEAYQETFVATGWPQLLPWLVVGLLVAGHALMLLLRVDTSWRRLKPRRRIWISAATVGFFLGLLVLAFVSCIWAAVSEKSLTHSPLSPWYDDGGVRFFVWLMALWAGWGAVFFVYCRRAPAAIASMVGWLLAGSVLELLVAVSTHVIVRRRGDCSAPVVTGFGIATGLAVMLACFGPGVLALYLKRHERYRGAREVPAQLR